MPTATTLVMASPVAPLHSPERTRSVNSLIWSSTFHTSGTTFLPSAIKTYAKAGEDSGSSPLARGGILHMSSSATPLDTVVTCIRDGAAD